MTLRSLAYREFRWLVHNWPTVLLLLIVLPSLFALGTVAFQQVIPRDTPVGVVAGSEDVTDSEMSAVEGVASLFSEPRRYESREAAMRGLDREDVYAVLVVPHGLEDSARAVTIEMIVEAEMVPYEQPSMAIASILSRNVGEAFPAAVDVSRTVVGEERTLTEYLFSAGALLVPLVYALLYVPRVIAGEEPVFRRVRVESSLWRLLAVKAGTFTLLMAVPLVAFQAIAVHLDLSVSLLAPGALAVTMLTFLAFASLGAAVMFLLRFRDVGRLVNATILFGVVAFGSLVYPAGFFSPLRRTIARSLPVHHAMIVQRGVALKDQSIGLYLDRLAGVAAFALVAGLFLAVAVAYYEWRA